MGSLEKFVEIVGRSQPPPTADAIDSGMNFLE